MQTQYVCQICQYSGKTYDETFTHILKKHENVDETKLTTKEKKVFSKKHQNSIKTQGNYPFYKENKQYQFNSKKNEWEAISYSKDFIIKDEKLSILTFNVLFDLYDKDKIFTSDRIPLIFKEIQESKANIIGLQEVTAPFLKILLNEKWLQDEFYVSDLNFPNYGQLIISKYPFKRIEKYCFSAYKSILTGFFQHSSGIVAIPCIHLTSDKTPNYEKKRYEQIMTILERSKRSDHIFIIGDFNYGDKDINFDFDTLGFIDSWKEFYPKDPGYTFDPYNNVIAKVTSNKQQCNRLDKIVFKSKYFEIDSLEIRANKEDKEKKIYPSDHYALLGIYKIKE